MTIRRSARLQPSKSYRRFEGVAQPSLNLLSLQQPVEQALQQSGHPCDLSDMARAAVVLSVAAMDAYFTDAFAERLVPYLKTRGAPKGLVELLQKAGLDTAVALDLLRMERPYRRVRGLMETYLERQTAQRIEVINGLFLAYGLKGFCQHVEKKAGRKRLLASVRHLVERRHQVAHDGDLNSRDNLQSIQAHQVRRRILDVVTFVSTADELLQEQLV